MPRYAATLSLLFLSVCTLFAQGKPDAHLNNKSETPTDVLYVGTMPMALYGGSQDIKILYVNRFRYDLDSSTTSTPINAPNPPALLGPSTGKQLLSQKTGNTPSTSHSSNRDRQTEDCVRDGEVNQLKACIDLDSDTLLYIRQDINNRIRNQNAEQACYVRKILQFHSVLLTLADAQALSAFAKDNTTRSMGDTSVSCLGAFTSSVDAGLPATEWPFTKIQDLGKQLNTVRLAKKITSDLTTQLDPLITEAASYDIGETSSAATGSVAKTYSDYLSVVESNRRWRDRLSTIARGDDSIHPDDLQENKQFSLEIKVKACSEWYGRGRTDTVTIKATDLATPPTKVDDIAVATNTCLPLSIASTGFGATFLPNPTFGLTKDAAGDQVISKTAVNDQSILYALLYNVRLVGFKPTKTGMELFASPGVGLTSASSTTTTDWLAGLSLGIARRLLFITGSVDFGNRTELLPGYQENTRITNQLSTVPTRTTMKVGAMVSISFGIAPN